PAIKPYLRGKAPRYSAAQAGAVIDVLHQAGGMAVLAHPVRYRCSAEALIASAADLGIDGVEAYYAYNNPEIWQPSPKQTERVKHLSAAYNLLNTCGTDTHGLNLLRRV
ncbi:MAG: PHP domain-containing protein, partial [Coleofasciculaceae cyanobacterium]